MAGLPWLKVYTDLPRDPRSLVLGDMLGDPRAWTYVIQFRMYLADNAPSGRLRGPYADVAFERCAGWTGERGRLLKSMRDAGFVRAGPARDGEGTEVEDLDWAREQGAHVAKVERDAKKPRGNTHTVVSPSRDIGGTGEGTSVTPRGESRELRVESREEIKDSSPPAIAEAAQQTAIPGTEQPSARVPSKPTTAAAEFAEWAREAAKPLLAPDAPANSTLKRHQWPKLGEALKAHGALKMQAAFRLYTGDPYWLGKGLPLGAFVADWEKWVAQVAAPKPPATPQRQPSKTNGMDFAEMKRRAAEVAAHEAREAREAAQAKEAHNGTPAGS